MIIEYSIDEKDFLTFQLFTASQSELIRKRRFRAKVLPPVMYLALGAILLYYGKLDFTLIFILLSVVWFFFYPVREKRLYRTSYEKFISENFKEKFGKKATLSFSSQHMINKDESGENKIALNQLEEVNEIPEMILVKLKKGQSFILPKNKIDNVDAFRIKLKEIAEHSNIAYHNRSDWKWK